MSETESRAASDSGKKIIANPKGSDFPPKELVDYLNSTPIPDDPVLYLKYLAEAYTLFEKVNHGKRLLADVKGFPEVPKILIETLEKMLPQDIPDFYCWCLEKFLRGGG